MGWLQWQLGRNIIKYKAREGWSCWRGNLHRHSDLPPPIPCSRAVSSRESNTLRDALLWEGCGLAWDVLARNFTFKPLFHFWRPLVTSGLSRPKTKEMEVVCDSLESHIDMRWAYMSSIKFFKTLTFIECLMVGIFSVLNNKTCRL